MVHFLHYPKKEMYIASIFLFQGKVLAPYRKIETWPLNLLFWVVQNFRSILRPLNKDLEKNVFNNFNCIAWELSKTVRNLKIRATLAFGQPYITCYINFIELSAIIFEHNDWKTRKECPQLVLALVLGYNKQDDVIWSYIREGLLLLQSCI